MAPSFSEYYEQAASSIPRVPSSRPRKRGPLYPNAGTPAEPERGNPDFFKDPIGATFDFLSRGVYGATNVVDDIVSDAVEAGKQIQGGDVAGGVARLASEALFNPEALPKFIEGLTTDRKDQKRFFSDTIEESTDKIGKQFDPNYIDRVDNVAGPVKGVAGFAADVVLDPLSYVPIPLGPIVKVARAAKGGASKAVEAVKTARTGESVAAKAVQAADQVAEEALPPVVKPTVTPRQAMDIPMPPREDLISPVEAPKVPLTPEALPKALDEIESKPIAPTMAKAEEILEDASKARAVDAAPAVAAVEAKAVESVRLEPAEIQDAFRSLEGTLEIPGIKGKVTADQAREIFLKVGAGARIGSRQKAIYEWVVKDASARKAVGETSAGPVTTVPSPAEGVPEPQTGVMAAPERPSSNATSSAEEARDIWANLPATYSIGEVPLTRDHLAQAIELERRGELPDEWESHLRFFREEAAIEKDYVANIDKLRATEPSPGSAEADELFEAVERSDDAAKNLAENDINPSPQAVEAQAKVQGTAEDASASQALIRATAALSMTPEQVIQASGQAERMKAMLDMVEQMVKAGRVDEVPSRTPIIPGTKGFGYNEQVVSDYAASFDYWVNNGLSDLADKNGMVQITRIQGEREWTEKVKVSDVQDWLQAVNDIENYRPVGGTYGPDISPEDYDRLLGVDALFREEIADDMVMNPAKEAVEITNVVDAWQYLIREKNDWLQAYMGEAGYRYVLGQMDRNPGKVAERMATLRAMLEPGYGLNDLKKLRSTRRLDETRPVLGMLEEEIPELGALIRGALEPQSSSWVPPQAAKAIDPEPTSVPTKDVPEPDPAEAEIAAQPSTITPRPSTDQEVIDELNKMSKPQSGKEVQSYRVQVGDDADLSEVFDVAAGELLATVIGRDIHDIPKVAPHKTKRTRANRTHKTPGEGLGWHLKKYNTQNQYTLEAAVFKKAQEISDRVFEAQGKGAASLDKTFSMNRARAFESMYLELRSRVDRALNKLGVKQVLGRAEALVPLSYFDIFTSLAGDLRRSLGSTDMPEYLRLLLFSNGATRVAPSNLMDAVQTAMWGGQRNEVMDALMKPINRGGREYNNFLGGMRKGFHLTLGDGQRGKHIRGSLEKILPGAKFKSTKGNMQWIEIPGEDLANVLADTIMRSVDDLSQKAVNNGWRMEERGLTEVYDMTTEVLQRLDDLYADPGMMADFMRGVARISDDVAEHATRTGAYQESADAAADLAKTSLGDDIVDDAERLVAVDAAVGKRSVAEEVQHSTNERMGQAMKQVSDDIDSARATAMLEGNVMTKIDSDDVATQVTGLREQAEILDYGGKYTEQIQAGTHRVLHPWLQRLDASYNHKRVWATTHDKSLISQEILNSFRIRLLHLSKRFSRDEISDAWQRVQMNVPVKADDTLHAELRDITSALWAPDKDNLFTNAFLSTEGSIEYINRIINEKFRNYKGEVLQFDIGAAKVRSTEATGNPAKWPNYLAEQWRNLRVDDPLDFIQRMSDAAVTVAERRAVVESFLHNARKWGAISPRPKEGFVRLNVSGSEHTSFGVFLAQAIDKRKYPNGLFIEKELAQELRHADMLTTVSRSLTGDFGDFINKTYMPVLNAWKISITIYRPGHHIRNMIGDSSLTYVARGARYYGKSFKDAIKVMSMRNDYTDVDMMKALRSLDGLDAMPPKQGDVIVRGSLGGVPVELTAGQIMQLLHTKGLRPTFHMGEGLFEDAVLASRTAKVARQVSFQDTKFNEIAGGISQYRDHLSRAQHFIQILNQELGKGGPFSGKQYKGIKDLESLFDRAAAEVKKYHPDASMLTPWESKFARPIVPFYSWFAKVLPAIAESTLRHPGRVMVFPKASYELAVATGVNPDTIYDPFPEDQLFPSFLTEKALGPQFEDVNGQYFGSNPGISHLDVFNTLGPDPVRGLLGMTSPIFRVPLELAGGGSWGTGARINDASDYVDSSIPFVNHLANFTGVSPTGTLESFLSGRPELDMQYQIDRGNKGGFGSEDTALMFSNWLTGLGIQNMSRPNYINYAELEQKRGEVPAE